VAYVQGKDTEKRLRALLDKDRVAGQLIAERGNKLSRSHYSQLLGVTVSTLTRLSPVFAEYESKLEILTGPMQQLAEMREWLAAEFTAQRLKIRNGKIKRASLEAQFNLNGGTYQARYPAIRTLLAEFDSRAREELYIPLDAQAELLRVRSVLANKPLLNKDRMTVNLVALSEVTGVSKARLRVKPFASIVDARNAEIMSAVRTSKVDPYFHGRVFAFSDLSIVWPLRLLERFGIRFKQFASGMAKVSAQQIYLQLIGMLEWVGRSPNPHCLHVVAEARERGQIISSDHWEEALFAYRDALVARIAAGSASASGIDASITALRSALDGLSSGNVIPATSIPLPGVKHARRLGEKRRSFAEVASPVQVGESFDYVAFARNKLN